MNDYSIGHTDRDSHDNLQERYEETLPILHLHSLQAVIPRFYRICKAAQEMGSGPSCTRRTEGAKQSRDSHNGTNVVQNIWEEQT